MDETRRARLEAAALIGAFIWGGFLGLPWTRGLLVSLVGFWLGGAYWYPILAIPSLLCIRSLGIAREIVHLMILSQATFFFSCLVWKELGFREPVREILLGLWCSSWISLAVVPIAVRIAGRARPRDAV